jgi:cellulose synthase/poly-beta-1,6-N-acetylglucosamine synthase-like glycosyltransferase
VIYAFYTLAALLIVQGVISLIDGFKYRAFIRRSMAEPRKPFAPAVSVIAPCKGIDNGFEQSLHALFNQDYPDYEILFVIASADDTASAIIRRAIRENAHRRARLVVAPPTAGRSQKVNNLLAALDSVRAESEALVFVDSDARVRTDWLASLIAPLVDRRVGAATGYRWYLPERGGFWSAMLSAWNGSVATTLGDHDYNFAWGGSTAILKETFDRIGARERWQHALSDDYALTKAAQEAGLRVEFVPRCLVVTREDVTARQLFEFTTRQIIITRVYRPRVWWLGLTTCSLFGGVFFGGLASVAAGAISGGGAWMAMTALAAIYLLGSMKGALRLFAASDALVEARGEVLRLWWAYCVLWPLVTLIFLYNFIRSATTRRITWRGVCYEMRSATETVVISEV